MVRNSWQDGMYSKYPPVQEEEHATDQQEEEERIVDKDVNNLFGNRNDNHALQQQATNNDESGNEEYDGSDDEMRNHSEPVRCLYHHQSMPPTGKSTTLEIKTITLCKGRLTMIMRVVMSMMAVMMR